MLSSLWLLAVAAGFPGWRESGTTLLAAALAHAALESSVPAPGDTVAVQPALLRLVFSEPIGDEFAVITLTSGSGPVTRLKPRSDPLNAYSLIADLPVLPAGGYLVSWRIVSADGHPVAGFFQFYSAPGVDGHTAAQILAGAPAAPDPPAGAREGPAGLTGEPPAIAALFRGVAQIPLLALAGLLVLPMLGVRSGPSRLRRFRNALAIATPLLLTMDFGLWLQHASPSGQVDVAAISAAFRTQNGVLYALRAGLAALALWALMLARSPRLAVVFAWAAIIASGATGHPAGMSPALTIPSKTIHLAATALWAGGLAALIAPGGTPEEFRRDAWQVSRIAFYSAIGVALTGLVVTFRFLPAVSDLLQSTYGRLVLAKIAGLVTVIVFGYRNRYRLLPGMAETGSAPLRRSVSREAGVMGAIIVLAAFLAYVSPPRPAATTGHEGHLMPPEEEHQ